MRDETTTCPCCLNEYSSLDNPAEFLRVTCRARNYQHLAHPLPPEADPLAGALWQEGRDTLAAEAALAVRLDRLQVVIGEALGWLNMHAPGRAHQTLAEGLAQFDREQIL